MRAHPLAVAALLLALAPLPALGEEIVSHPAVIRAGSCAEPGAVVHALDDVREPEGEMVGHEPAYIVETSDTGVEDGMVDLTADPMLIEVHRSDADPTPISCGDIGGIRDDRGGMTVLLQPVGDDGVEGHAYLLRQDSDYTRVYLSLREHED